MKRHLLTTALICCCAQNLSAEVIVSLQKMGGGNCYNVMVVNPTNQHRDVFIDFSWSDTESGEWGTTGFSGIAANADRLFRNVSTSVDANSQQEIPINLFHKDLFGHRCEKFNALIRQHYSSVSARQVQLDKETRDFMDRQAIERSNAELWRRQAEERTRQENEKNRQEQIRSEQDKLARYRSQQTRQNSEQSANEQQCMAAARRAANALPLPGATGNIVSPIWDIDRTQECRNLKETGAAQNEFSRVWNERLQSNQQNYLDQKDSGSTTTGFPSGASSSAKSTLTREQAEQEATRLQNEIVLQQRAAAERQAEERRASQIQQQRLLAAQRQKAIDQASAAITQSNTTLHRNALNQIEKDRQLNANRHQADNAELRALVESLQNQ